jgi:hypothetical protein
MTAMLDDLLAGIDTGIISQRNLADLRSIRNEYQEVETGLSLARRMVQGRLDILLSELDRRHSGNEGSDGLLGRLPEVLGQQISGSGNPRPTSVSDEVPEFVGTIDAEISRIVSADRLARLGELDTADVGSAIDELQELEQAISSKRHSLHRVIDEINEEIVGRYRSGQASVDDLLR